MIQGKQGKALLSVNNQDVLVLYKPIKNTGYSIATQIAYDEINQPVTDLIRTGVLVFLGAIFLVIGISFYLSRKISQPIVQLSKAADDIREGLWDSALPSSENYEVNHLSTAFKLMISTLKEREQSLINSKEVAEEASLAKSKFLSSMSHELRTPLNAILGYAQLLQMDNNDADTNKSLQEIAAAGNHLLELINEILDLSKIESGKMHLNIDTYHLNELLNECLSIIQPAAYKRSIDINYENCELLSVIKVDKKLFKQILLNLLSNAVKYNNENGKIIISCETQDTLLKLSITDTGNGLTNEQLKIIFNLYERGGAEYSPVEGAGLGLVISKELIELMHGEIGVESEPGKGSCFWLKIPLAHS